MACGGGLRLAAGVRVSCAHASPHTPQIATHYPHPTPITSLPSPPPTPLQRHPDQPRVFLGANGTLAVGVLPVASFSGGHTYYVQRLYEVRGGGGEGGKSGGLMGRGGWLEGGGGVLTFMTSKA